MGRRATGDDINVWNLKEKVHLTKAGEVDRA
jgi:hypothetical protein